VAVKKPQKSLEKADVARSGLRPAHKGPPNSRSIKKNSQQPPIAPQNLSIKHGSLLRARGCCFFKKHLFKNTLAFANPALARPAARLGHSFGASRHSSGGISASNGHSFGGTRGAPVDNSLMPLILISFHALKAPVARTIDVKRHSFRGAEDMVLGELKRHRFFHFKYVFKNKISQLLHPSDHDHFPEIPSQKAHQRRSAQACGRRSHQRRAGPGRAQDRQHPAAQRL
jgi:hypothetical protein